MFSLHGLVCIERPNVKAAYSKPDQTVQGSARRRHTSPVLPRPASSPALSSHFQRSGSAWNINCAADTEGRFVATFSTTKKKKKVVATQTATFYPLISLRYKNPTLNSAILHKHPNQGILDIQFNIHTDLRR